MRSKIEKYLLQILIGLTLIIMAVLYYFYHPSINLTDPHIYRWILYALVAGGAIPVIYCFLVDTSDTGFITRVLKIIIPAVLVIVVGNFIIRLVTSEVFFAKSYAKRITVEPVSFGNDTLPEVDFTKTPIIDRESTETLGDKVMGEMPELVSQFEVSNSYTQISYKNSVYRVTPLEYAGFIKYLNNKKEGIPAYITVDSTNGKTKLVKLSELGLKGMKYVPSAYFNYNLNRKLQLDYPTTIFGSPSFEIDEEGHPWYVCTTYKYFGIGNKKAVSGMILFDPITGDSTKYKVGEFPDWVDRVFPESLVMEEIDDNGSLQSGFINSIFGQKNVMITSDGYNYLSKDGDIWIYSGITSANSDSSNLGFVLTNLRTHETKKFSCSGANEYSAMASAEGEVKNYGYNATFPLLINVGGNPVYLLSLKDDSGLVKQYAMVDAKDYQKVTTINGDSVKYLNQLKKNFLAARGYDDDTTVKTVTKTIEVENFTILNVEGATKVFITDTDKKKYKVEVSTANEDILAFLKKGQKLKIEYIEAEGVNVIRTIGS